jgi:hypothetical protein
VFGLAPHSETLAEMLAVGLVTEEKFAFYFAGTDEYSYFDIGLHDETALKSGYVKSTKQTVSATRWAGTMRGVRFGFLTSGAYSVDPVEAYIDTVNPCLVVPSKYFLWLLERLYEDFGMTYTSRNGAGIKLDNCMVREKLPSLFLLVSGSWYQVLVRDYIVTLDDGCYVCIERGHEDMWGLGIAVLRGYYTEFDLVEQTWSMTPHQTSKKMQV